MPTINLHIPDIDSIKNLKQKRAERKIRNSLLNADIRKTEKDYHIFIIATELDRIIEVLAQHRDDLDWDMDKIFLLPYYGESVYRIYVAKAMPDRSLKLLSAYLPNVLMACRTHNISDRIIFYENGQPALKGKDYMMTVLCERNEECFKECYNVNLEIWDRQRKRVTSEKLYFVSRENVMGFKRLATNFISKTCKEEKQKEISEVLRNKIKSKIILGSDKLRFNNELYDKFDVVMINTDKESVIDAMAENIKNIEWDIEDIFFMPCKNKKSCRILFPKTSKDDVVAMLSKSLSNTLMFKEDFWEKEDSCVYVNGRPAEPGKDYLLNMWYKKDENKPELFNAEYVIMKMNGEIISKNSLSCTNRKKLGKIGAFASKIFFVEDSQPQC